jgi:hypothetical protein
MNTEELIRSLVSNADRRDPPVGAILAMALFVGGAISTLMFLRALGVRHDIDRAIYNPFFDLKFLVTIALFLAAVAISIHLSRPEASLEGWKWLLLIPIGLLLFGIMGEMTIPHRLPWLARLIGSNSSVCLIAMPILSLPLLAASLVALRHGAPSRPGITGAFAGMLSAGFAGTLYVSQCTDDSPLFVGTWYTIAIAITTGLGAILGRKVLRF